MWPFKSRDTSPKQEDDKELRLERLERQMRDMRVDWDTTYDKFRVLLMRLTRREQRAAETPEDAPGRTISPTPDNGSPHTSNPLAQELL
jgi:hypothetical protein